jgi:hypothetical protein
LLDPECRDDVSDKSIDNIYDLGACGVGDVTKDVGNEGFQVA